MSNIKLLNKKLPLITNAVYVQGEGYPGSPIVLIGESPGAQDTANRKAYTGPTGQFLRASMLQAGFRQQDLYYTYVVKVKPPGGRKPTLEEINSWLPSLRGELTMYMRDTIVLLGKGPEYAYSQLSLSKRDWIGSAPQVYSVPDPKYVPRKSWEWIQVLRQIKHNTVNFTEDRVQYYKPDKNIIYLK